MAPGARRANIAIYARTEVGFCQNCATDVSTDLSLFKSLFTSCAAHSISILVRFLLDIPQN